MRSRHLALGLLVLLVTSAAVGCASPPSEEDAGGSADEVKLSEVLPSGAIELTKDEQASAPAGRALEIASWSLYYVNDTAKHLEGVVAYGLDPTGEVKLAVSLGASDKTASGTAAAGIVRFDAKGVAADQEIPEASRRVIDDEMHRLGTMLRAIATRAENDQRAAAESQEAERRAANYRRLYPRSAVDCFYTTSMTLLMGVQFAAAGIVVAASAAGAATAAVTVGLITATITEARREDDETTLQSLGRLVSDAGDFARGWFEWTTRSCGVRR